MGGSGAQLWDQDEFLELEAKRDDLFAQHRQVVLLAMARLFDETMGVKPTHDPGHLTAVAFREPLA